ncbi:GSCFA domain-containing protein [Cyanobium sp. Morenito 9A2]|uniref:GSCFA domain-containing protein n=1 Tax=Cyanobium sp. Morenito 9A2 TaxID=2823718 RepID=UPI0020CE8ADE|nr:GSCFA domain-containing protein [Cyanobium sp. Morenito 9A2]MCP9851219.1 GSCFA domain-containing protein [Cyanobium sp. Morenito 9A2]
MSYQSNVEGRPALFEFEMEGEKRSTTRSFYRGENARFHPDRADMLNESSIPKYILDGWMPKERFVQADSNVVAFGSCFASNIGRYLAGMGFNVTTQKKGDAYVQKISDGMVNVHSIAQQFEWAWENRVPGVSLWHGWKAEDFGYDENVRLATKKLFDEAQLFILTFGLSEVWYDEPTGEVFWRAIPQDSYDPTRHKFRSLTFEETYERLNKIYALIRRFNPSAGILFTLSPIPLRATFRPISCITANSISKSIIRVAIDKLHEEKKDSDDNFFYFPAFEIATQAFKNSQTSDLRHPQQHVISYIMSAFERYFCNTEMDDEKLGKVYAEALKIDADQDPVLKRALRNKLMQNSPRNAEKETLRAVRIRERDELRIAKQQAREERRQASKKTVPDESIQD